MIKKLFHEKNQQIQKIKIKEFMYKLQLYKRYVLLLLLVWRVNCNEIKERKKKKRDKHTDKSQRNKLETQ